MFNELPSAIYLKECFDYDKETGSFKWRARPRHHFQCDRIWKSFNAKHSGKMAFLRKEKNGYRRGKIDGVEYLAHRIAWKYENNEDPEFEIDHINGNKSDNSISNLRCVDHAENMKNTKKRKDNKTGISGVSIKNGKFYARVQSGGKRCNLGYFDTINEAELAITKARHEYAFHQNHGL